MQKNFGKNAISEIADALYNSPSARQNLQNMMERNLQNGKSNKGIIRPNEAAHGANAGFEADQLYVGRASARRAGTACFLSP